MSSALASAVERAVGERAGERPDPADFAVGRERLHDRPAVARLARDEREAHGLGEAELGAVRRGHGYTAGGCVASALRARRGRASRDGGASRSTVVDRTPRDLANLVRLRRAARRRSGSHRYTTDTTLCGLPYGAGRAREHADELARRGRRGRPPRRSRAQRSAPVSRCASTQPATSPQRPSSTRRTSRIRSCSSKIAPSAPTLAVT